MNNNEEININNLNTPHGKVLIHKILFNNYCYHCKKIFDKESIVYIGKPYMILLHFNCLPFYDFNNIYPHENPLIMYN